MKVTHEDFINLLMLSCFGDMLLKDIPSPEIEAKFDSNKINEIFMKLHVVLFKSDISQCYQCELQEMVFDQMLKENNG